MKNLLYFTPTKSSVPNGRVEVFFRKLSILGRLVDSKEYRSIFKHGVNQSYRKFLSNKFGVKSISVPYLVDWSKLSLKFLNATQTDGQTSHLELLCILALTVETLKNGGNFLEIGTYDGNTAFNVASNLPYGSEVITIDLPELTDENAKFSYDNYLVHNPQRSNKKHLHLDNVKQVYSDSKKLNFSEFKFKVAFIDGGHDFETVKSDTVNCINNIQSPGVIIWHDYDVECEIGDLLHFMASDYRICHIEGTRLAYLKI